ncbi:TAXI family TRAP transporter solute-binding subunit [Halalkalibacter oceani]|uniref:TAXI family TRAP transporter solute-binding subunit n=1 Tax=Halalkalibacter oceani TaxID=1653776 RepID=UPI003393FB72
MKKWIVMVGILALMAGIAGCNSSSDGGGASGEGESVYMTIGAPPASSALYGYWVAAAKSIESVYPEFNFTVTESQGAVDISKRVRDGLVPVGNSVSNTDYDNYYGEGSFEGEPFEDLRMIWYFESTPMQWIVTKDSGITELSDLNGERFNPGSTNSSAEAITQVVFEELGIEPDYFTAVQADAADAVVNRQIIGTSKAGPTPDSFVQQIQGSLDIEMLSIPEDKIDQITEKYQYLVPHTIPAGTYEGIDYDVNTVTVLMGAQATSELPQEVGYKMFKAIWEDGKDEWAAAYPVGAENDVPALTLESRIPLHAGAVQYLKEIGMDVPDELIPPEYEEE